LIPKNCWGFVLFAGMGRKKEALRGVPWGGHIEPCAVHRGLLRDTVGPNARPNAFMKFMGAVSEGEAKKQYVPLFF